MPKISSLQICFGVRNLVLARSRLDNKQRRFARSKLYVLHHANLAFTVEQYASHQVADVNPTRLQLRTFAGGDLQLAADQGFGIGNRIDAFELQSYGGSLKIGKLKSNLRSNQGWTLLSALGGEPFFVKPLAML